MTVFRIFLDAFKKRQISFAEVSSRYQPPKKLDSKFPRLASIYTARDFMEQATTIQIMQFEFNEDSVFSNETLIHR